MNYRIRHCDGNKSAWLICRLNADGTESSIFGCYWTSMSIDGLLNHPAHRLEPNARIELIQEIQK